MTFTRFPELHRHVLEQFELPDHSPHGPAHWGRVAQFGAFLAEHTAADPVTLELFALLHDARRTRDGVDHLHGPHAARFLMPLRGQLFDCTDEQFRDLVFAVREHTDGAHGPNVTIGACWDSDRLDLMRVGIRPSPKYLSTPVARLPQTIQWAVDVTLGALLPEVREAVMLHALRGGRRG
ncbi:hypothetical protein [Deinococcus kurensis]|uniref:hypothetical protein n=1 Tax=Deinococcus kurensis TaxID=2662757 RepID=UPI0012D2C7DF|nr:hypothetical protein [Deinococcus kurensis]